LVETPDAARRASVRALLKHRATPPESGADGPIGAASREIATVRLGGADQTVMIRAADLDKPVLLYLSGGLGQSDLAYARLLLEPLTADFVVAVWDQRGSGRSYAALDPARDVPELTARTSAWGHAAVRPASYRLKPLVKRGWWATLGSNQ
jgi:pimeloyl-ACP methyl ester carboxylesterase